MRAWDLDDCEVAIAQLKEEVYSLKMKFDELNTRLDELEDK